MKTRFTVHKGEINFSDNQIIITDGIFKLHSYVKIVSEVFYLIGGVYMIVRYFSNQNILLIVLGIAAIIIGIIGLITGSKVSTDRKIDILQVDKAVIREDFASNLKLTLYLKDYRKRKVILDYRDEDRFSKFYTKELIETFRSFGITVEEK